MWRLVDFVWTNVSEERLASTFRVEKSASEEPVCNHLLTLVPTSMIFLPWKWRRYVPPKRRFTQNLHGATSQKTTFFILTAVKTSNLMNLSEFGTDLITSRYQNSIKIFFGGFRVFSFVQTEKTDLRADRRRDWHRFSALLPTSPTATMFCRN
jgi:hypothetical protein